MNNSCRTEASAKLFKKKQKNENAKPEKENEMCAPSNAFLYTRCD